MPTSSFGAVLDEHMGDEVKITVIATGFRQEMAERRERMLNAALRNRPCLVFKCNVPAGNTPLHSEDLKNLQHGVPVHVSAPVTVAVPVTSAQVSEPVLAISDPRGGCRCCRTCFTKWNIRAGS